MPGGKAPEFVVATAAQKVFAPVAAERGAALKVTDIAAPAGILFVGVGLHTCRCLSVGVMLPSGRGSPRPPMTEEVRPINAVSARVLAPRVDADHRR